ncbi:MAG: hypothetical protein KF754_15805 [Planctomycetes bacterium]|nr:hypothetical protein [Planctomycetota bacterium]
MTQGPMQRLAGMLGQWSGQVTRPAEPPSRLDMEVRSLYAGTVLEIESRGYSPEGRYLFGSLGFLAAGEDGRLVYQLYATSFGMVTMHEHHDEPQTLLLQAALDAERTFHATMALDGDVLALSASISRDGKLPPRAKRVLSRLERLHAGERRRLSPKMGLP